MVYPYVQSHVDLGVARGPRRAVCWHFAEGGGTVGYLAKDNPNGVSVHFVVEYTGRIVQMLRLDRMHTSIRASAIRTTDDAPYDWRGTAIVYGRSAAKAVLGEWADTAKSLGPNHASIGVEIEGFAARGPNDKQKDAMARLWTDLRARYPGIRSLGHRDFASYKACPGKLIPWEELGGHGPTASEPPVGLAFRFLAPASGTVTIKGDGHALIRVRDEGHVPVPDGQVREVFARVSLLAPLDDHEGDRQTGFLVGKTPTETRNAEAAFVLAADVTHQPTPYTVTTTVGGKTVSGTVTLP